MVVYVYDKKNDYKKIHSIKNAFAVFSLEKEFEIVHGETRDNVDSLKVEKEGIKLVVYGF